MTRQPRYWVLDETGAPHLLTEAQIESGACDTIDLAEGEDGTFAAQKQQQGESQKET